MADGPWPKNVYSWSVKPMGVVAAQENQPKTADLRLGHNKRALVALKLARYAGLYASVFYAL